MKGNLHIFRAATTEGPRERRLPEYQINYTAAGRTYAGMIEEPELTNFFRDDLAMNELTINEAVAELRTSGQTTIGGLELTENDANEMGLKQSSSDI